jgi:hypothetical protein
MGFPKDKSDAAGKDKQFGNAIPEDEKSNINWQRGGDRIGPKSKVKFGTSSVAGLNTGVKTSR